MARDAVDVADHRACDARGRLRLGAGLTVDQLSALADGTLRAATLAATDADGEVAVTVAMAAPDCLDCLSPLRLSTGWDAPRSAWWETAAEPCFRGGHVW